MDGHGGESRDGKLSDEQGVKNWRIKANKSGKTEFSSFVKVNVWKPSKNFFTWYVHVHPWAGEGLKLNPKKGFFADLEDLSYRKSHFGLGVGTLFALQLDAALGNQATGLGVAGYGPGFLDQSGHGELLGGGPKEGHFSGGEVLLGELGLEVRAGGAGGSLVVKAADHSGCEFFLGLHGVGGNFAGKPEERS
jgi:hypothetical protein